MHHFLCEKCKSIYTSKTITYFRTSYHNHFSMIKLFKWWWKLIEWRTNRCRVGTISLSGRETRIEQNGSLWMLLSSRELKDEVNHPYQWFATNVLPFAAERSRDQLSETNRDHDIVCSHNVNSVRFSSIKMGRRNSVTDECRKLLVCVRWVMCEFDDDFFFGRFPRLE